MLTSFIRARRPDGSECTVDLLELETALDGANGATYFFIPASSEIVVRPSEDVSVVKEEGEQSGLDGFDVFLLDPVSPSDRFEWMEEFIGTVHSVTAKAALGNAIRQKKPFRQFKETLLGYPAVRKQWFIFQDAQLKRQAIGFIESLDWEILEVADSRLGKGPSIDSDPAARMAPTNEERESILRGASQIAGKAGRSQLALLLKGSKNEKIFKHDLDKSPVYGKLSFLTIEEIENRIDYLIRSNDLRLRLDGDLPLIELSARAWVLVRPWSNELECGAAATADKKTLNSILEKWSLRPRPEQFFLLDAVASRDPASAQRILTAWHRIAGQEVRAAIRKALRSKKSVSLEQCP